MGYIVGLLFCVVGLIGGVGVIPGVEPIWLVVPGTMFTFSLGLIWLINLLTHTSAIGFSKETK